LPGSCSVGASAQSQACLARRRPGPAGRV